MALLSVENLEVAYGEVQVIWGIDLPVEEGTITALIGATARARRQR